jgi:hypothetical protein
MHKPTGKEAPMQHRTYIRKTLNTWRSVTAALGVTVIAATTPALAQAHFAPGDLVTRQPQTHYSSGQLNQLDELGPKYITVHRHSSPTSPTSGSPRGFDWRDTGAGLGSAAFALALLAAARILIKRHRRDTQPEQRSLAGA